MSSLLAGALEELQAQRILPELDAEACVVRVDVHREGDLLLELSVSGASRWFSFDDRGILEQEPGRDSRIPLAQDLDPTNRVLAYRPGRRIVTTGERDGRPVVLKGFRRRRSMEVARKHRVALAAARHAGFEVPLLLFHDRRREVLEFQWLSGEAVPLDQRGCEVFFRVGARIARFQSFEAQDRLDRHGPEDELDVLKRFEARARYATGALPENWTQGLSAAREVLSSLTTAPVGLCHRDLHDGQFLLMPQGIGLLDHDLLCIADTALDPANLLAHLALRGLQGAQGADAVSAQACGDALLEGLDPSVADDFWIRLRLYEAFAFLRLALIYSMRPRWSSLGPVLTQLARRCLVGIDSRSIVP